SMTLTDGSTFGINTKLSGSSVKTVNQIIDASVYKRNKIEDNYNELTLKFKGDYNIIFRAYNDGIAYRFVSTSKKPLVIENEQAEFNFPADQKVFVAYANKPETTPLEGQFSNS
ncbi:glycoside hydrolase family 97 N-terminal domain-containing protein, partial [Enterobacter roggenkampii]|nr:glycoside hydrolase family 97 N-terminal domain-containing protein [Enterobacter roggenkampii]